MRVTGFSWAKAAQQTTNSKIRIALNVYAKSPRSDGSKGFSAPPRQIPRPDILKSGGCTLKSIPRRDQLLLWTRAAGLCSHPSCRKRLTLGVGEAAHIIARSASGPRGAAPIDPRDRNRYPNLILLCPLHHSIVDTEPDAHSIDVLRAWKSQHEAWVSSLTDRASADPWTAILHETHPATTRRDLVAPLGYTRSLAGLIELRHETAAAQREFFALTTALAAVPDDRRRYAVFSTGRIPLAVQLGYVLGDRSHVELFQYDRERGQWSWPPETLTDPAPVTWTLAENHGPDAAIRVSLSATVSPGLTPPAAVEIDIRVPDPSVYWLRSPAQLAELARVYAEVLAALRDCRAQRIHLYYAGPAPGAVAFGRAYNRTMNPPLLVYDFRNGRYEAPLTLNRRAGRR